MKHLLLILICLYSTYNLAQLKLEGTYLGYDLYVQNPTNDANSGYCVDSVLVNDKKYNGDFEMSAFQIKLSELGFQIDDPIFISIYHETSCKPKILNHQHQYTSDKFTFDAIEVNENELHWTADNNVPGQFEIQVYRWNKWITIDTLNRKLKDREFSHAIDNLHSGENQLRIRFVAQTGKPFLSNTVLMNSANAAIEFEMDKKTNVLTFSNVTHFEIYDEFGLKIMEGRADNVLLYRLSNKKYYLNLDNRNEELKLKR